MTGIIVGCDFAFSGSSDKKKPQPTAEPEPETMTPEGVIYNQNGIKVTYITTIKDDFVTTCMVKVENKSDKDYYLGALESSANDKTIDLLACDLVKKGETKECEMFILNSDLDDQKIEYVETLKFKLLFQSPEDWEHEIISNFILIDCIK